MRSKTTILTVWPLFLAMITCFLAGCENSGSDLSIFGPKEVVAEDHVDANERARLTKENKLLNRDIKKLKADNEILESRVQELTIRERRLTQKLGEVQLDNSQLKKANKIYSELPAERDRYKLKYNSAMQTVAKLRAKLEKLEQAETPTSQKEPQEIKPTPAATSKPAANEPEVENLPTKLPIAMPATLPAKKALPQPKETPKAPASKEIKKAAPPKPAPTTAPVNKPVIKPEL